MRMENIEALDESKGLPADAFTNDEVEIKADLVFEHIFQAYEDAEHSRYVA